MDIGSGRRIHVRHGADGIWELIEGFGYKGGVAFPIKITSAGAVAWEFCEYILDLIGYQFRLIGFKLGADCVSTGSQWPLWVQKWSWTVGSQNCENLVLSKVIFHCKNKALGSVRQTHEKKSSKSYVFFF